MRPLAVLLIRKEPAYRRLAFEAGLKRLNYDITEDMRRAPALLTPDDLLISWNLKAGKEENDARAWERRGGTVIVAENGYLQKTDKTMYALSTHGHNGSGWYPYDMDEGRFDKLGFELQPWRDADMKDDLWMIFGQRGIGSSLMASPPQWGEKLLKKLKGCGLNAHLRQHPGNFAPKTPLLDDIRRAGICCIWSSSAGVRALVEGRPVQTSAPHWICDGGSHPATRYGALNRMAHGQWHHEEIATGEPFARMRARSWGPREWKA